MLLDPHRVVPVNHSGVMTCEHELGLARTLSAVPSETGMRERIVGRIEDL